MNPSRNSYTTPTDYNQAALSKYAILSPCEFCHRTFIPDSLVKHRKVCYKDYLKKKKSQQIGAKNPNLPRSKSTQNYYSSGTDLPGMSCSELMLKRQIRRMHWRGRHEQFIQSIREAREYAMLAAGNNGVIKGPLAAPPLLSNNSLESRENMQQCKYCLRNFQKDSFEKHLKRCKEYSIKSLRSRPNSAQIEAKRRLSLRLYYKPKSFRGDSPDDLCTTVSSNDFDCQSSATIDSQNILNRKSRASSYISICGNPKTKNPKSQNCVLKRHKSSAFRQSTESPCNSVKYSDSKSKCNSKLNESQNQGSRDKNKIAFGIKDEASGVIENKKALTRGKSLHRIADDDFESFDSVQFNRSNKDNLKADSVNQKLKVISNILNSSVNYRNATPRNFYETEIISKYDMPNPAESLKKAKEILKFLDIRIQENEIYSQNFNSNLMKDFSINEDQLKSNYKDPFEEYLVGPKGIENRENSPPPHNNNFYKINSGANNTEARTNDNYQPSAITKTTENKSENLYRSVNVNETANRDSCNGANKADKVVGAQNDVKFEKSQPISGIFIGHSDPEYAKIWQK